MTKENSGLSNVRSNDLLGMIGRDSFKLSDGTECRRASIDGANIKFEYKNYFGWQSAWMPPDTAL